ncbi:hypothetical protein [Streptomyces rubellomurinus]|uniref:Chaplin domain-containing protein n=2 Tax=Streptomyces TaxID=1883 RepID=A0A0F2TK11_STRR3|nr:hypothetical protein [Streptomyces rubellomurinus]KJS52549.1 hypothetical protein VM98_30655 [Streptomyces rubellomurinus subsp. indigoferus]KJS62615.1 hypothetical protein VM95_07375 [Streptomyces rubellomurinus]
MTALKSALTTACCALLLAAPLALAQPAAADSNNHGPKNAQEAAACRTVVGTLLGGFGSMLANSACVVQPSNGG